MHLYHELSLNSLKCHVKGWMAAYILPLNLVVDYLVVSVAGANVSV